MDLSDIRGGEVLVKPYAAEIAAVVPSPSRVPDVTRLALTSEVCDGSGERRAPLARLEGMSAFRISRTFQPFRSVFP